MQGLWSLRQFSKECLCLEIFCKFYLIFALNSSLSLFSQGVMFLCLKKHQRICFKCQFICCCWNVQFTSAIVSFLFCLLLNNGNWNDTRNNYKCLAKRHRLRDSITVKLTQISQCTPFFIIFSDDNTEWSFRWMEWRANVGKQDDKIPRDPIKIFLAIYFRCLIPLRRAFY